jgi:hypothetical protein
MYTPTPDPSNIDPSKDGIDHINVYSKGKTELGKILSNWDSHPIKTPVGLFYGIEPLLFYLQSCGDPMFWVLKGYESKKFFNDHYSCKFSKWKDGEFLTNSRSINAHIVDKDGFNKYGFKPMNLTRPQHMHIIIGALWEKYLTHPKLKSLLEDCKLPLKHYYVYGKEGQEKKVVNTPDYRGIISQWEIIKAHARRNRDKNKIVITELPKRHKWSRK